MRVFPLFILWILLTFTTLIYSIEATKVEFIGMDAPSKKNMSRIYSDAKVRIYTSDKDFSEHDLSYKTLFSIKDKVGTNPYQAGQLYNAKMKALKDPYHKPVLAETPDANSLLNIDGKLFLVTHLEYDWVLSTGIVGRKTEGWYSRMPMSMLLTSIEQDKKGFLHAVEQRPIDFSSVNGLWIPCFGSQTPWNTHLGTEEDYELYFTAGYKEEKTQKGLKALTEIYFDNKKKANPYHYGFITEVEVKKDASTTVTKHYSMGRGTWEMAKVLDDGKTAYFGDDGKNVGMFMYVADKVNDLSAGTLYASQWKQTSPSHSEGGRAKLSWIKLGHATDKRVKRWTDKYSFDDIFDHIPQKKVHNEKNILKRGYKKIRAGHTGIEYLRIKKGKERVAAFLEPRRYAALIGATTEWNKMEGIAYNPEDKKLYMAISYVKNGMLKDKSLKKDDIKIARNLCGATYELKLKKKQRDKKGKKIKSDLVATSMRVPSALLGQEIKADKYGNTCAVDSVANTDNLFYSSKMRTLFIGEDSDRHTNNFLWAYNIDSKKLVRILSLPAGAESTGLQVIEDENNHAYIMSNAQHLGDFIKTTPKKLIKYLRPQIDLFNAPIGYIYGIPALQ
jgi:secreted PhoX family phosphatase